MRTETYQTGAGVIREGAILIHDRRTGAEFPGFLLMPPESSGDYRDRRYWLSSQDERMFNGSVYSHLDPTVPFLHTYVMTARDTHRIEIDGREWIIDHDNRDLYWMWSEGSYSCGHKYKEFAEGYCKRCFDKRAQNLIMSERLYTVLTSPISVRVTDKSTDVTHSSTISMAFDHKRVKNVFTELPKPNIGNFFDIRKNELSFSSNGVNYNSNGKWERRGRQVIKPSKLVRHMLSLRDAGKVTLIVDGSDHRLCFNRYTEMMADNIRADRTTQIRISSSPTRIYRTPTSHSDTGTLGSSCMRPESNYLCKTHADFYDEVGAKIAYSVDADGNLKGRALVWEGAILDEGHEFTFMDRIYGSDRTIAEFKMFAHENGWAHKTSQTHHDATIIFPDGDVRYKYWYNSGWFEVEDSPFMDTLCFYDEERKILRSWEDGGKYIPLQNPDGNGGPTCANCGRPISEDYCCYVEGVGDCCEDCTCYDDLAEVYILDDDAVYVEGRDIYTHCSDDLVIRIRNRRMNGYYMREDVAMCEHDGQYYWADDVHYNEDLEMDLYNENVEEAYEEAGWELKDEGWVQPERAES